MKSTRLKTALLAPLLACAGFAACTTEPVPRDGTCEVTTALTCDTVLAGNQAAGSASAGLVAYSCTGTVRPDDSPSYVDGYPSGLVCAQWGPPDANGALGYCCTPQETSCAFNPVAICPAGNYGFQCYGTFRPEALNPSITCGNGVREDNLIDYCCAAEPRPPGCTESKGMCMPGLTGWNCMTGDLPRGEDFGANESRSDNYYFVCSVPIPAPNPAISTYCCFTPSPLLPGGSCVPDPSIQARLPGCTQGRFGFSCYGRERPEADYLPITCTDAPVDGNDANGYKATLYCCDFVMSQ